MVVKSIDKLYPLSLPERYRFVNCCTETKIKILDFVRLILWFAKTRKRLYMNIDRLPCQYRILQRKGQHWVKMNCAKQLEYLLTDSNETNESSDNQNLDNSNPPDYTSSSSKAKEFGEHFMAIVWTVPRQYILWKYKLIQRYRVA